MISMPWIDIIRDKNKWTNSNIIGDVVGEDYPNISRRRVVGDHVSKLFEKCFLRLCSEEGSDAAVKKN